MGKVSRYYREYVLGVDVKKVCSICVLFPVNYTAHIKFQKGGVRVLAQNRGVLVLGATARLFDTRRWFDVVIVFEDATQCEVRLVLKNNTIQVTENSERLNVVGEIFGEESSSSECTLTLG